MSGMVELIIYRPDWDGGENTEELARVGLDGTVTGDTPTANAIRERLPRIQSRYTDARDILCFLEQSYTNGYIIAAFDSEESLKIVHEMSDAEFAQWESEQ